MGKYLFIVALVHCFIVEQKKFIFVDYQEEENMRKFIFLIVLGFGFSLAGAQEFEGGVHAGLTASQVHGDRTAGFNKAGLFVGGYVSREISEFGKFIMELNYIQKGSRQNPTEENGYESYKLNLHYVEMPFLYNLLLFDRFSVEAGLAYGVFIAAKESHNESEDVSAEPFNRHNVFFVGGVNYLVTDRLRIQIRSNNSITPIRPHPDGVSRLFNQGQYSDLLSLGLQYRL